MRDDVAVLISRAEAKGAAFRVREDRVEVCGLERLPDGLVVELQAHKGDVLRHLSSQAKLATSEKTAHLLAWATELSGLDVVLSSPVKYVEAPERTVITRIVSSYAARYLNLISSGRMQLTERGGWTPECWREREEETIGALGALRDAMRDQAQV